MEFNEAHSHARQMGKFFKAFALLEEVLVAAANAEQATRNAIGVKVEVDKELAALSAALGEVKVRRLQAEEELQNFEAGAQAKRVELTQGLRGLLGEIEMKREAALKDLQTQLTVAETEFDESKAALKAEIRALVLARDAAKAVKEAAEKDVLALQTRVGQL